MCSGFIRPLKPWFCSWYFITLSIVPGVISGSSVIFSAIMVVRFFWLIKCTESPKRGEKEFSGNSDRNANHPFSFIMIIFRKLIKTLLCTLGLWTFYFWALHPWCRQGKGTTAAFWLAAATRTYWLTAVRGRRGSLRLQA